MKTTLMWIWLLVSGGAVVAGSWLLTHDALSVVIASIVWVLASGWVLSRIQNL